jgi:hypothetical protein
MRGRRIMELNAQVGEFGEDGFPKEGYGRRERLGEEPQRG